MPTYKNYRGVFHGFGSNPKVILVDGEDVKKEIIVTGNTFSVALPITFMEVLMS